METTFGQTYSYSHPSLRFFSIVAAPLTFESTIIFIQSNSLPQRSRSRLLNQDTLLLCVDGIACVPHMYILKRKSTNHWEKIMHCFARTLFMWYTFLCYPVLILTCQWEEQKVLWKQFCTCECHRFYIYIFKLEIQPNFTDVWKPWLADCATIFNLVECPKNTLHEVRHSIYIY